MASCAVRRSDTLAWNSHEVGIEFAVGILVVEDRHSISAWRDPRKFADCLQITYYGTDVRKGFVALLWKAIGGRIERAHDLSLAIT